MTWASFLDAPSSGEHAVQIYDDLTDLVETVASFLDAGFRADEPALLVITADHVHAFEARVESDGWNCAELRRQGLLAILDADETLGAFMANDGPSPLRFREAIGRTLDELVARRPAATIRVFGEMVDVLSRQGHVSAAIALEELWNDLSQERRFALLCGYQLDVFELEVQTQALPEIFRVHSCQRPVADPARLAAAVDKALLDTVGPREAGNIYLRVAEAVPRSGLPRAQAVRSWLSSTNDSTAQQVLSRARALYATA